ncbi:hypothetical protein DCAR_0206249 [Daucus carota subsp. sativus]|uniref:Phosphatase tensin-type domain-containing protein n=1 Tax=Daucus carota subsp. sativus TaxID=79200 RepID=A0AAF1AKY0_DAUCS|nr:hypothetical protein DCAR_0206249 [Daucus carota subsp. sativus]
MGVKLSKPGQGTAANTSVVKIQHQVINYLSRSFIRNLVSKKRRRMLVDGYDLDMTYITNRVLAMSFPAERIRAMYRNPMWQIKCVLDMRHKDHYKVFNLCIEQAYDPSHFHGRMERFPFDDNHVPSLRMMKEFCESVDSWISSNPKNIVVVHCMVHGMAAEDALQLYADRRTTDGHGVSIPSQRRYVGYWEKLLSVPKGISRSPLNVHLPEPCNREVRRIRIYDAVNIKSVFFVVSQLEEVPDQRYQPPAEVSKNCCRPIRDAWQTTVCDRYYYSITESNDSGKQPHLKESRLVVQMDTEIPVIYQKTCLEYHYKTPVKVSGDVRVAFYEKMIGGRLFYLCFNTTFISNNLLQFTEHDLDKVGKRGRSISGSAFCVELLFGPRNAIGVLPALGDA